MQLQSLMRSPHCAFYAWPEMVLDTRFRTMQSAKEERLHEHFIEHFLTIVDRDLMARSPMNSCSMSSCANSTRCCAPKRPSPTADDVDPVAASTKDVSGLDCPVVDKAVAAAAESWEGS